MAEAKLTAVIEAEDRASATIAKVGKSAEGLGGQIKNLQPIFKGMAVAGTLAFGAVAAIAVSSIKEFADAQAQMVIANQAIENGFEKLTTSAKKVSPSIDSIKQSMKEVGEQALKLGFDDEAASVAFAKLYQVSGSVTQAQKDIKLAMNLSAFSGRSLAESADAVTKVHAGATKVLKEFGIQVQKNTTVQQALEILDQATHDAAVKRSETLTGRINIMNERVANLRQEIGGALAPALTKIVETITPFVEKITDWVEKNPQLSAGILLVVAGLAGMVAVVGILGVALGGLATAAAGLGITLGVALGWLLLIPLAIAAIIAIGVLLYQHWDVLKQGAIDAFNNIGETILAFWSAFKSNFETAITWIKVYWIRFKKLFTDAWDAIKDYFKDTINSIVNFFKPLTDVLDKIWNKMVQIANGVGNVAKKAGSSVVSGLTSFGHALGFAEGGIVTKPTLAMIGEGGESEAVIPLSKLGSIAGGRDININISGAIVTEDAAKVMGDMIISQLRMQLKF